MTGTPRFLFRKQEILKILPIGSEGNFLEVGGGNLLLSKSLLDRYSSGTVVEMGKEAITAYSNLPKEKQKRLSLKVSDFLSTKIASKFDLVIACEVMEHIKDDDGFLKKLKSLTKEGGHILLTVPALQSAWNIDDELVGHYRRYDKNDLKKLLSDHGLTIEDFRGYGFPFVNLLRILRIHFMKKSTIQTNNMKAQSEMSGFSKLPLESIFYKMVINSFTFYPLFLISSLFKKARNVDGYIILARKR